MSSVYKNIFFCILLTLFVIIVSEISLRLVGFSPAHAEENRMPIIVVPDSFLVKDNHLGWIVGTSVYDTYLGGQFLYRASVDSSRKRESSATSEKRMKNLSKPKIFILGCSYTFGVGVPDSGVCAYYLQSMLPEYEVQNLAVPAYGLTQMYLTLKQNIEKGNKPDLVILNYGTWQDERTYHKLSWLRRFKYAIIQSAPPGTQGINYPRCSFDIKKDSLIIDKLHWDDWPSDFPLRDKSVLIDMINNAYDNYCDHNTESLRQQVVLHCALKISSYCNQLKIPIFFYGLNASMLIDSLKTRNIPSATSHVDISQEGWNCAPLDPGHPNAQAHEAYAREIFDYLKLKK